MAYTFEDYDTFLASFGGSNDNSCNQGGLGEIVGSGNIEHNPSLTNSLSTEEDETGINGMNMYYDFNNDNQNFLLSPDSIINSSTSNSPNEFQLSEDYGNGGDFELTTDERKPNYDTLGRNAKTDNLKMNTKVKQELSDSMPHHKVKLSEALPQSTIHKHGHVKKEKSSHNMIEKRYRTNINDKIQALRDSVPALRVLVDSADDELDEQLDGLQPAKKLNKATILLKATEYIKHLEAKNEILRKENDSLKVKLYSSSRNFTPNTSVASSRSNSTASNNNSSFTNKVLMGGLACMVGAGLNDDLNNVDSTRSLFAAPMFTYNQSGVQVLSKPFLILIKFFLLTIVMVNFIFPQLFKPSSKKEKSDVISTLDDIRSLKYTSILSTFGIRKSQSNNTYVKNAMIRCILLKTRITNDQFSKVFANLYVSHLWSYLKKIKLDKSADEYEVVEALLSVPNDKTIDNEEFILRLNTFDASSIKDGDYSVISILYSMMNEARVDQMLKKFMLQTIKTDLRLPEITKGLKAEIGEFHESNKAAIRDLETLFNPNDSSIEAFKSTLEKVEISDVKNDEILVLYAAIIQNLVFEKKDYQVAKKFIMKIDSRILSKFKLLGFTSLYIIILSIIDSKAQYLDDQEMISKLEEMSGVLRIWLGNSNGAVLNLEKRSKLIDFFVNVNVKINGLEMMAFRS